MPTDNSVEDEKRRLSSLDNELEIIRETISIEVSTPTLADDPELDVDSEELEGLEPTGTVAAAVNRVFELDPAFEFSEHEKYAIEQARASINDGESFNLAWEKLVNDPDISDDLRTFLTDYQQQPDNIKIRDVAIELSERKRVTEILESGNLYQILREFIFNGPVVADIIGLSPEQRLSTIGDIAKAISVDSDKSLKQILDDRGIGHADAMPSDAEKNCQVDTELKANAQRINLPSNVNQKSETKSVVQRY